MYWKLFIAQYGFKIVLLCASVALSGYLIGCNFRISHHDQF